MPQSPTPNLGLIKPTESGDTGVWASLLDAMFDLLDQHDHSPGKGVLVPMATGVRVAADVPWSSGGSFFAITNLKAIDFQPQASVGMSTYAGALFVNSVNNELTYRTTGGALIQFTSGSGFNFAAIGGIGGDYSGVNALVDFTDATDTYALRQQLGSSVRQFARLQTGDVDFFEFKAQPAAGVPTNRVRLKSPAALAASYDVTWLTALPAGSRIVTIDNAGQLAVVAAALPSSVASMRISAAGAISYQVILDSWHASAAQPNGIGSPTYDGVQWSLGSGTTISCPIKLPVGSSFTTWKIYLSKASSGAGTINVSLRETNMLTGSQSTIGATQTNNANAPGAIQLSGAGTTIAADRSYCLNFSCTGASGDFLYGWTVLA
jgi:hypothetical protein